MKNVIIVGASGSLTDSGFTSYVARAKQKGLQAVMLLTIPIIEGDVLDYVILKNAITGHDIGYVNLAGNLESMGKEHCESHE